ncbi:hypothetical protein WJX73_006496 [Symbiochloris irregularis]|uniref:AP2/ERF domain-containing protein n=1 Tax=Symbiochloris irregularis TaxID=706552 RepID=A0AAW1P1G0_9CHLO
MPRLAPNTGCSTVGDRDTSPCFTPVSQVRREGVETRQHASGSDFSAPGRLSGGSHTRSGSATSLTSNKPRRAAAMLERVIHRANAGGGPFKSSYRGVSFDRKKRKWRVQIKVANLGKSGVSVGYYDTEDQGARAYDRAAIGLLGRDNPNITTNYHLCDYASEDIPDLKGLTREQVKEALKTERAKQQAPKRRPTQRMRTSQFLGVGSSHRKNQWQARILVDGKVTHLGYYETEEEAARVYDRVALSLHGKGAQVNYDPLQYGTQGTEFEGMSREELQRALGVKPMDKSSRYRGVSRKKGRWEAKVMVDRRWAFRDLYDSETEAAQAYDDALWKLKPEFASSYANFRDGELIEFPSPSSATGAGQKTRCQPKRSRGSNSLYSQKASGKYGTGSDSGEEDEEMLDDDDEDPDLSDDEAMDDAEPPLYGHDMLDKALSWRSHMHSRDPSLGQRDGQMAGYKSSLSSSPDRCHFQAASLGPSPLGRAAGEGLYGGLHASSPLRGDAAPEVRAGGLPTSADLPSGLGLAAVKIEDIKMEDLGMEGSPLSPALVSPSYAAMLARLPSDPASMLHHTLSLGTLLQGSGGSLSLLSDFSDLGADTALLHADPTAAQSHGLASQVATEIKTEATVPPSPAGLLPLAPAPPSPHRSASADDVTAHSAEQGQKAQGSPAATAPPGHAERASSAPSSPSAAAALDQPAMQLPSVPGSSSQPDGAPALPHAAAPLRMTWGPVRGPAAPSSFVPMPPRVRTHFLTQQRTVHGYKLVTEECVSPLTCVHIGGEELSMDDHR